MPLIPIADMAIGCHVRHVGKIVSFTDEAIDGLSGLGIAVIYVDLDDDGTTIRELGLDASGAIVHRHPGTPSITRHGLFDLQTVETQERSDSHMPADQFVRLWEG